MFLLSTYLLLFLFLNFFAFFTLKGLKAFLLLYLKVNTTILRTRSLGYIVSIQGINGYIIYIIISRRFSFAQAQLLLLAALLINFLYAVFIYY
jgi:hypothetical protein